MGNHSTSSENKILGLVLMLVWILIFSAYSPPERLFSVEAGQLDWIAMVKLVTRIFACLVLGITLLRMPPSQMKRKIFWCLLPFGLFAGFIGRDPCSQLPEPGVEAYNARKPQSGRSTIRRFHASHACGRILRRSAIDRPV